MYKDLLNPEKALIFRICHRDNIPKVFEDGGCYCWSAAKDGKFVDIGNRELIAKRKSRPVPCGPGGTLGDIDQAFARLAQLGAGGLVLGSEPFFVSRHAQLATLALRHGIPMVFYTREFAAAGGLASYGGSVTESHRLSGHYAGRILKGENPANLPVQQSTKVELIINMKTAKALGLVLPITLLGRADEVIE